MRISVILINNYFPMIRNDQTLLSAESVKTNLIFFIKQTGNNVGTGTFNVSVLFILTTY